MKNGVRNREKQGRFSAAYKVIEPQLNHSGERFSDQALENIDLFRALFSAMREVIVVNRVEYNEKQQPVNYRLIGFNEAFCRSTGLKREEALGKLATEVYRTTPPPHLEEYLKVVNTGQQYDYTTYSPAQDRHFSISVITPAKDLFATITSDITASRQMQEMLSARNRELENYLYVTSHDLRSPLVNIQGFSQRLVKQLKSLQAGLPANFEQDDLKQLMEEGIPKTLEFITSGVNKMDNLLNGLLQLSRTGRAPLNIKLVDMNRLFTTILSTHSYELAEIEARVNQEELPNCYGDESLLNQLFTNIITNAIKYRDRNKPLALEIKAISGFKKVIYSIKDNGIGIEKQNRDKIWNLFFRVNPTAAEAGEGLGLSIVRKIAEKHHGKIWVESESGVGSVFYVVLLTTEFQEY